MDTDTSSGDPSGPAASRFGPPIYRLGPGFRITPYFFGFAPGMLLKTVTSAACLVVPIW
jgi:hypothetical protein